MNLLFCPKLLKDSKSKIKKVKNIREVKRSNVNQIVKIYKEPFKFKYTLNELYSGEKSAYVFLLFFELINGKMQTYLRN